MNGTALGIITKNNGGLKAIEGFHKQKDNCYSREIHGIQKYYEGLYVGLDLAERLFECSNYEKEDVDNA